MKLWADLIEKLFCYFRLWGVRVDGQICINFWGQFDLRDLNYEDFSNFEFFKIR